MVDAIEKNSSTVAWNLRIRGELLDTYEMNVNHKLVSAIMTELGIAGLPRPGKRKPNLLCVETLSDRVNRGFTATWPNELWFTDITEHPARDGKFCCCVILDCSSKNNHGSFLSATADTALVNNVVNMAAQERICWEATILHADRGSHFTSWSSVRICGGGDCSVPSGRSAIASITRSWRHSGRRLQTELLNTKKWSTTLELTAAMVEHIDTFHSAERRHSYLGNISPIEYEKLWADTQPYPQL